MGDLLPRDLSEFTWVNTVLGNLKTTLAGAYNAVRYRKYPANYQTAFVNRFNRRFKPHDLVRLCVDVARTEPGKEAAVRRHAKLPIRSKYVRRCD